MPDASILPYASPADAALAPRPFRLLPLPEAVERRDRLLGGVIAGLIAIGYLLFILQYWAPAHPGVDQNGYLVGGRMLAETGSTGYKPQHDLGFVGAMWVRNDQTGVNYPKYPIGLSLLYAICLWIFGAAPGGMGVQAAFLVSPVSSGLGVLGMYFLARQFCGVFGAVSAMLLFAFSQLTLSLANNPNSHASCVACVVWGVFLLLRFWETASLWRGLLGGFLLGFAVTIRYTEGLLGLLIGLAVLGVINYRAWRQWKGLLRAAAPVLGWLIPVAYLVIFNLAAMGTPTGYDTTNESKPGSAFTPEHIAQNWEKLIRQVHDTGMFFSLPLALLGMLLAFRASARRAWVLWLWLLPGTLTYMSYYWAPDRGVAYLRFFLTLLPPLAVGVGVTIDQVQRLATDRMQRIMLPIGGGLVVVLACGLGLYRGILGLEDGVETGAGLEGQYRQTSNLALLGERVTAACPEGSTIISNTSELHYLQFAGRYDCFSVEMFTTNYVNRLRSMEDRVDAENDPMTQQPARRRYLLSKLEGKDEKALSDMQLEVVQQALGAGRRVFLVLNRPAMETAVGRLKRMDSGLSDTLVARFQEFGRLRPEDLNQTPQQQQQRRTDPNANRNNRRGNFGGGPGAGGPGGPPGGFGRLRDATPQAWQVVELTRQPPAPARPVPTPAASTPAPPKPTASPDSPLAAQSVEERLRQRRAETPRPATTPATLPATVPPTLSPAVPPTATTQPTTGADDVAAVEERMRQRLRARAAATQPATTPSSPGR